jgi:carbamoyltransferase
MSLILGLNFGHADSSACLLVDGRLTMAVAEERLGRRVKHDPSFPALAIRAVLDDAGVKLADIDAVAVPRNPRANMAAKIRYVLAHPGTGFAAAREHLRRDRAAGRTLQSRIAEACGADPASARFRVVPVEHHLAHVSSAYYCSPFDGLTAGFSYDGSGDFASLMAARCEGTRIDVLGKVVLPDSLGFFYTAICQLMGFDRFGEEYKVMGLAAYGDDAYAPVMERLVELPADGWFRLARGFFGMHQGGAADACDADGHIVMGRFFTDRLAALLGPKRPRDAEIGDREKNLARSCQARFEAAFMHCARRLHRLVPTSRIAYAGGCALNGVANARLLRDTPFVEPYLQAASSDEGCSLGAALWAWHNVAGGRERFVMKHAYWGPEHSEASMADAARSAGTPWRSLAVEQVVPVVARLIRAGLVVGWYQGRSEWGPRALGNRSILADPTRPEMKDVINAKIKRREMFRPFAPTVLRSAVSTYFEQDVFSPFMMHVVKIRPEWRSRLPAVTHVDGTGRLQSIDRETNPIYHDLIEAFAKLSGVAILLNTSFNENEPIVDTPEQALACFLRTGLDALCLGREILVKGELAATLDDVLARADEPLVPIS